MQSWVQSECVDLEVKILYKTALGMRINCCMYVKVYIVNHVRGRSCPTMSTFSNSNYLIRVTIVVNMILSQPLAYLARGVVIQLVPIVVQDTLNIFVTSKYIYATRGRCWFECFDMHKLEQPYRQYKIQMEYNHCNPKRHIPLVSFYLLWHKIGIVCSFVCLWLWSSTEAMG